MNERMNVGPQHSDTDWKFCVGLLGENPFTLLVFSLINHTCNGLGLNPGFDSERLATKRLKHGTALVKND